ncbi:MAG: hypothetical protein WD557_05920 [Dehalococcoidia bacterium]
MLLRIGIALIAVGIVGGIVGAIVWGFDGPNWDREVEYQVVNQSGEPTGQDVTIVREDDRDGPPFFPFFPLVLIGGVLVAVALFTRGRGGWGVPGGPRGRFEEWHRDAHRENGSPPSSPSAPAAS